MLQLEICIDSIKSAINAVQGGADRLEVCSALALGGLTPSFGFVKQLRNIYPTVDMRIMIRCREGDFVYSEDELKQMVLDIESFRTLNINGFVFGCLTTDSLDCKSCSILLDAANPLPCTFHRAFDIGCNEYTDCDIKSLSLNGFTTVLTSGGEATAIQGRENIKKMMEENKNIADKIDIMAGCGLNSANLSNFLNGLEGITWVHASASVPVEELNVSSLKMGSFESGVRKETSMEEVWRMKNILNRINNVKDADLNYEQAE